jgi:hypothetical protein
MGILGRSTLIEDNLDRSRRLLRRRAGPQRDSRALEGRRNYKSNRYQIKKLQILVANLIYLFCFGVRLMNCSDFFGKLKLSKKLH